MNAISLSFKPTGERKIGQSKLGGRPDLPKNFSFPKNKDGYDIPFLCQLNLGEFENEIAPDGILYFFCQLDDTTEYGAVRFSKDTQSLSPADYQNLNTKYMGISYPLTESTISFEKLIEVAEGGENYYKTMGRSRVGGSVFKSGADHSRDGRISLLQFNSNEVEELDGEVENLIHFLLN